MISLETRLKAQQHKWWTFNVLQFKFFRRRRHFYRHHLNKFLQQKRSILDDCSFYWRETRINFWDSRQVIVSFLSNPLISKDIGKVLKPLSSDWWTWVGAKWRNPSCQKIKNILMVSSYFRSLILFSFFDSFSFLDGKIFWDIVWLKYL